MQHSTEITLGSTTKVTLIYDLLQTGWRGEYSKIWSDYSNTVLCESIVATALS